MKKLQVLAKTTVGVLALGGMLMFGSCKKDACKDVTCQNSGVCNAGACDCATGYSGTNCETVIRAAYLRTGVTVNETCVGGATGSYITDVTAGTVIDEIKFKNLGNYNCSTGDYTVTAKVTSSGLTITSQTQCATTFAGTGSIAADGTITVHYTADYTNGTGAHHDDCTDTIH